DVPNSWGPMMIVARMNQAATAAPMVRAVDMAAPISIFFKLLPFRCLPLVNGPHLGG
ncbi:hypothetical protein LCGC14_3153220, partial [marine sediment metagenome]